MCSSFSEGSSVQFVSSSVASHVVGNHHVGVDGIHVGDSSVDGILVTYLQFFK